ncbi:hypothetical protein MMC21_001855 [Puttea exsequens]|nr:hypothetical protein [Puttea exsequens]
MCPFNKFKSTEPKQSDSFPGLLPTAQVNIADASTPTSGNVTGIAGGHLGSHGISRHHDADYYYKWNKERQEAIARGEDPNAKFLAMVKAREDQSKLHRLKKALSRRKEGKEAHGEALTADEEGDAMTRDLKGGDEAMGTGLVDRDARKDDGVIR